MEIWKYVVSATSAIAAWLKPAFTFDRRAIRAFRFGLSSLLLIDLFLRSRSLEALYGCQGVFPFPLIRAALFPFGHLSLHGIFCETWQLSLLFLLQFVCAILLFFEVSTKLVSVLSLLLLVSLQQRNPFILYGGDTLLRVLLLWSLFLPSGKDLRREEGYIGAGSICYVLQLLLLYWYTASGKNGPAWQDGSALHYVLQYESFATPFAVHYRELFDPWISFLGTRLVIFFEFLGPLLWFSPVAHSRMRMMSVCAFILMHLVFGTFIVLDIFPLVNLVSFLPLIPAEAWDCFFPKTPNGEVSEEKKSFLLSALAVTLFSSILLWNLDRWPGYSSFVLPSWYQRVFQISYLQQKWIFFEPDPPRDGGWWIIPGYTRSGKVVDVFHLLPGKPSFTKPKFISLEMKNPRWVKVYSNIWLKENHMFRPALASHLCREWDEAYPDDPLASLELEYFFYRPEPEASNLPFPMMNRILKFRCPKRVSEEVSTPHQSQKP